MRYFPYCLGQIGNRAMSRFDSNSFLASPSIKLVDSCRKDELAQIASHFGLMVPCQVLKKELKALVLHKLVEMKPVQMPVQTEPAVVEDVILGGEAGCLPLEGAAPVKLISRVAQARGDSEREKPPATLP